MFNRRPTSLCGDDNLNFTSTRYRYSMSFADLNRKLNAFQTVADSTGKTLKEKYHNQLPFCRPHVRIRNASCDARTFFRCNPISYLHRLNSQDIVFSVVLWYCSLQINSSMLSGAYQVHLYVKYKYLHFKYIQSRLELQPKHVLPFAIQIGFHSAP